MVEKISNYFLWFLIAITCNGAATLWWYCVYINYTNRNNSAISDEFLVNMIGFGWFGFCVLLFVDAVLWFELKEEIKIILKKKK